MHEFKKIRNLKKENNMKTMNKASYLRHGRGMSIRAIEAYQQGEMPATKWAKELGLTTEEVRELLTFSSWHHTGKYARRTEFYTLPEEEVLYERAKNSVSSRKKKFWSYINEMSNLKTL
jgi:hypothetical protein